MWETIGAIVTNKNIPVIVLLVVSAILIVKLDLFGIEDGKLRIGSRKTLWKHAQDLEREVLRRQLDIVTSTVRSKHAPLERWLMDHGIVVSEDKVGLLLERVIDLVLKWCALNSMRTDPDYVSLKKMEVRAEVRSLLRLDLGTADRMAIELYDEWVDEVIAACVKTRKVYGDRRNRS